MKNVKRINESQLRAIVAESVKKVLAEAKVVRGTNTDRNIMHSADDYREYHDVQDNGKWENDKVPDFVQTWANRLESLLNKKHPVDLNSPQMFDVTAHVDNNASSDEYLSHASSYMQRNIVFTVYIDNRLRPQYNIKKLQQEVIKAAYLVLGNIEDSDLNFRTDWNAVDVILTVHEESDIQHYGFYDGDEESRGSKLFAHNPSRQIGKEYSTFKSDED